MSRLDTVQVEQLEEIGVYLKTVRERQGQSLDAIATKTFIPLRLLKAIETGNAQPLPEPVFVQGFIRRYAEALGLDGMRLSQRFSVEATSAKPSGAEPLTVPVEPVPVSTVTPEAPHPAPSLSSPSASSSLPPTTEQFMDPIADPPVAHRPNWVPAYVVGGLIVLIGLGYGIAGQFRAPSEAPAFPEASSEPAAPRQPSPQPAPEAPAIATSPVASPSPTASVPSPQPTPNAQAGPVAIAVSFQGTSWVEVTIDGEVAFEGTLDAGTQRTWSGQEQVTIVAGNAGAVLVSYNQGQATPMGELGEVQERSFPPVSTAQTAQTEP